ncbi:MAG TPA: hypothetical protein VFQ44_14260 [Streptosporangiaceae bacterium]|nr:hypothetical protein [Streptosporangiaceae bacterium]
MIESPAQLAAQTTAPAASVVTGVARMRVLRDGIVLSAIVRPGKTIDVTASAPYRAVVVTKMPAKRGRRLSPGEVAAEIDGRPVVLLRGRLPAYRNLRIGSTGPDVRELQSALTGLGYSDFDPGGFFGAGTALALQLLYQHLGYRPPTFTPRAKRGELIPPVPQVYLPMDEVSYLPAASALVVSAPPKVGTSVRQGQPIVRLATGNPYITASLTAHQAARARAGILARITLAGAGKVRAGKVISVSPIGIRSPAGGTQEFGVSVRSRRVLPERSIGSQVRLTLVEPVTTGPVLTVPLTAVFSRTRTGAPSTTPYVVRIDARGHRVRVAIDTGPQASGLVAVRPVKPGMLGPGDRVLIGAAR